MWKFYVLLIFLYLIFYNKQSLSDYAKDRVALELPDNVKKYNKEELGNEYFLTHPAEAMELDGYCIVNEKWKYEKNTKIFLRNCVDANVVSRGKDNQ